MDSADTCNCVFALNISLCLFTFVLNDVSMMSYTWCTQVRLVGAVGNYVVCYLGSSSYLHLCHSKVCVPSLKATNEWQDNGTDVLH